MQNSESIVQKYDFFELMGIPFGEKHNQNAHF